jgi:hypothetical protein
MEQPDITNLIYLAGIALAWNHEGDDEPEPDPE